MDIGTAIEKLSKRYDCYYLYTESAIKKQMSILTRAFPNVSFLYSVKCNPNTHILNTVFKEGFGSDAASVQEVVVSAKHNCPGNRIFYSAPGKTDSDIRAAWNKTVLIADSLSEILRISQIAKEKNTVAEIGVRINPNFTIYEGDSGSSKFGIDEEQLFDYLSQASDPSVRITGIHIHLQSQILDLDTIARYYLNILSLADLLQKNYALQLKFINMGSGIGISYGDDDRQINLAELGARMEPHFSSFRSKYPNSTIIIETGRFIAGPCGTYVTKVIDRKVSDGKTYLIAKNTLNGFLKPSIASMMENYIERKEYSGTEPLFTGIHSYPVETLKTIDTLEKVTVAGSLCTVADVIAKDVLLPHLEAGDIIMIPNAGAYGSVLSPMQFSLLDPPKEVFLTEDGLFLDS